MKNEKIFLMIRMMSQIELIYIFLKKLLQNTTKFKKKCPPMCHQNDPLFFTLFLPPEPPEESKNNKIPEKKV